MKINLVAFSTKTLSVFQRVKTENIRKDLKTDLKILSPCIHLSSSRKAFKILILILVYGKKWWSTSSSRYHRCIFQWFCLMMSRRLVMKHEQYNFQAESADLSKASCLRRTGVNIYKSLWNYMNIWVYNMKATKKL